MTVRLCLAAAALIAAVTLAGCGVPLQTHPEPLPDDVVPTFLHVQVPSSQPPGAP